MRRLLLALLLMATPLRAEPVPVSIPGPGGLTLRALLVPAEGGRPGVPVIALHGCGGLAPPGRPLRLPAREAAWAARLSALGHPVIFPDSFGSRGLGRACGTPGFPARPEVERREDALAALAWAASQPWARPGRAVLLGWSHGGSAALAAAGAAPPGALRGTLAFYPGCGATLRAGGWAPAAPVMMLLGEADDWTSPNLCLALARGAPGVETVLYPGAGHGFDAPGEARQEQRLPDGRTVHSGGQRAAREAAAARVEEALARWGG